MSEERKRSATPWIAGVVLMLLGLYVGAYYATVYPVPVDSLTTPRMCFVGYQVPSSAFAVASDLFTPIHWLDRRIRPHIWEPTP